MFVKEVGIFCGMETRKVMKIETRREEEYHSIEILKSRKEKRSSTALPSRVSHASFQVGDMLTEELRGIGGAAIGGINKGRGAAFSCSLDPQFRGICLV